MIVRLALLWMLCGVTANAFAHKMIVNVTLTADTLTIDSFFEDETPADEAKVQLIQSATVRVDGLTDKDGKWSIKRPPAGEYQLRVEHYGHVRIEEVIIPEIAAKEAPQNPAVELRNLTQRITNIAIGIGIIVGIFGGWWYARQQHE